MKTNFDILLATRKNILSSIKDLNLEQLNFIPPGFKNNIAWNFGHILLVQRLLTYGLSNVKHDTPQEIIDLFKKGAAPDAKIDEEMINYFKDQFIVSVNSLVEDYDSDSFNTFKPYPTSYGYTLNSIEEAIVFNNTHEGLHFGYIMAMKKLL